MGPGIGENVVVGTDAGGVPELITSGRDGILVPPKEPETLARAIGELAADPARLAQGVDPQLDRAIEENPLLTEVQLARGELLLVAGAPAAAVAALNHQAGGRGDGSDAGDRQAAFAGDRVDAPFGHRRFVFVCVDGACRQTAEWIKAGFPDLRVAVNLSGRQFVFYDQGAYHNSASSRGMVTLKV